MNIETFVIHLKRAQQRREHVENLIATLPFRGHIIEAVDGRTISHDEKKQYYQLNLHKPSYPFAMSDNEIACFMSHRKAWRAIVESELDAALVMEDDAQPASGFQDSLDLAIAHIDKSGFIRFPFRDGREKGETIQNGDNVKLIQPRCAGLGMVAQLISKRCAEQLLHKTEKFDRPVDTLMQMHWVTGIYPQSTVPGGICEVSNTLGGTTLEKRRNLRLKLKREILRPIYRLRISHRAGQNM